MPGPHTVKQSLRDLPEAVDKAARCGNVQRLSEERAKAQGMQVTGLVLALLGFCRSAPSTLPGERSLCQGTESHRSVDMGNRPLRLRAHLIEPFVACLAPCLSRRG